MSEQNHRTHVPTGRRCQSVGLLTLPLRNLLRVLVPLAALFSLFMTKPVAAQNTPLPQYLMDVVRYNAPFIIGEDRSYPGMDHPLSINFDGDLFSYNNELSAIYNTPIDQRPTVYFSISETGPAGGPGFYFIGYYMYHPFDGGFTVYGIPHDGHVNDMEGIFLVVQKGLGWPYGVPIYAMTEAHGVLVPFVNRIGGAPETMFFGFAGEIMTWDNPHSGRRHPVVAIRSYTHGTYMAQDCSPNNLGGQYYDGYGMWAPKSDAYTYQACVHGDSQLIIYEPAFGYDDSGVAQLDRATHSGFFDYRLVDVATSPMWQQRLNSPTTNGVFGGPVLDIGGGQQALSAFADLSGSKEAQPPWNWAGGGGADCKEYFTLGGCWYTFAQDATDNFNHVANWPAIPIGTLLTDPARAARTFFSPYNPFDQYTAYNPYLSSPPPPPLGGPLAVSIQGPDRIYSSILYTYRAHLSGGTPPYTRYQWSFGTPQGLDPSAVNVKFANTQTGNRVILFDVWDAVGNHLAVSKSVFVTDPTGGCGGTRLTC
jgi:hypothetical protein